MSTSRRRPTPHAHPAALALVGLSTLAAPAAAQTLDDGFLLPHRQARVSVGVAQERWSQYWEGTRRRDNENIGTLTTETLGVTAGYGVTSRLSVFASVPYVRTQASAGVLHGQRGWQDLTVAAKLGVVDAKVASRARLGALLVTSVGAPTSDYTPDFLPLSIGLGARRATTRGTLQLLDRSGLFVEGSAGHTWRSTVRLDRPAYYTNGRLTLSDEVAMPDVADWAIGGGVQRGGLCLPIMLVGQRTLGGGDIRRQDMPFVSNRMDFVRVQGMVMYALPFAPGVLLDAGAARTLAGRNVGQGTMLRAGVTTAFRL